MQELLKIVREAAENELVRANEKFPLFSSKHEGYAVLLEEYQEARDEANMLEHHLDFLWMRIKNNEADEEKNTPICRIETEAINLAAEAIQVAAMAMKFKCLLRRGEDGSSS